MPITTRTFSIFLAALIWCSPAYAQDKSAAGVVQLPTAGGTVTREQGSFSLNNNTGSANFQLPLPELPQRGRFGPTMNLTYNQFAGDPGGGLGVGWSFTVPAIALNDDLGTAVQGVKPDGDFFSHISYAGARLVYLGRDGGVRRYRPEFSSLHVEIRYHEGPFEVLSLGRAGENVTETIPSGFEVLAQDGSRMIFSGAPAAAEGRFDIAEPHVTKWPLVLHINANRDPIRFSYEKHGGRSYLTEVAYAGGQSVYSFQLIDTQASLVSHVTGTRQQNAKLYGKVTASFDGTVYNQWCFGYIGRSQEDNTTFQVRAHPDCLDKARQDLEPLIDRNSVNVLDQLRILYRFGDTAGAALSATTEKYPSIQFDYSSWTVAALAARDIVFEAPNMAWAGDIPPWTFELADLNMDALVDIVRTGDAATTLFAGAGELKDAFVQSADLMLARPSEAGLMKQVVPRIADDRFHFADVFGDSYVDIVEIDNGVMHVFDGKADGSFPYLGRVIPLPAISPLTFADGNGRFQDLNMDGRSDIITTRLNADGKAEWQIFLNLTRRQEDGGYLVNFGTLAKALPFESQDGQMLSRRSTHVTDINGDRLPDFVVIRPADKGFCIYENQGNIFSRDPAALLFGDPALNDGRCGHGRFSAIQGMQPADNLETMWYVDANGDGIMDFASMGTRTDELRVWLGFGDGTYLNEPVNLQLNLRVQVGAAARGFRSRVADIDADGQSEIVVFQKPSGDDVKAVVVLDFNRTSEMQLTKANLLTTVAFDSGRRHDIRYATSTDEMLRDRAKGVPTRNLHFPVVLAKQMVTSEGVPGQSRDQVQTEEFFYHSPYYDVINGRFIGFADVDKVTYGDEFAGGRMTQKSSIAREQYYAFAETGADLHLAGKLKIRKTYEVVPDPVLMASAEATVTLDPGTVALHSLSTATRRQDLPKAGKFLRCESAEWIAVANGDGTNYMRKVSDRLTEAVGSDQTQDVADEACVDPTKRVRFEEFDAFNVHHQESVTVRDVPGPLGLTVPGFNRTTQTDYDDARSALAPLGIVNVPSERRILSGTRVLSRERFTYLPERGGRMGSRTLEVFSGLRDIPDALTRLHLTTHALGRKMDYDVFGNIVGMNDEVGRVEAVAFEATGTLPLSHTKFAGREPVFDQVTRMTYDGPRRGAVAHQMTPLGVTIEYQYDSLGRKIAERADDGAEKLFRYRIGEGGLPSIIMTAKRRYVSAATTPEGESEWIDEIAAYNARGNQIAEIENVAEGGVRVFNFAAYNRNEKQTFRWTPFSISSLQGVDRLDVRKVFELGDIPRPGHETGNAYSYDALGRMVRETHPSGKVSDLEYEIWGDRRITTYDDQFAGSVATEELRLANENGITAAVLGNARGTNHVTRFVRDTFGYLTEIWLPGENAPRRFIYNSVGDLEYQAIPGMGEYFYFYDSRGRQTAKARVAAGGETKLLEFRYDFLNRKVADIEDGVERVTFTYDEGVEIASAAAFVPPIERPLGEITRIVAHDPNGLFDTVRRFGYDRNGRMVQNETEIAGKTFAENFHHTLDGRIDRSTEPGGLKAHFALGPDRNLKAVTIEHPAFTGPEKVIDNIAYNAEGRIRRIDYRRGAFTEMTYDPNTLFLTKVVSKAGDVGLQDLSMTFNQNGSITEIVDGLAGSPPAFGHVDRSGRFEYDFKNQLVRTERYGRAAAFEYSEAGAFARNDEFEPERRLTPSPDSQTGLIPAGSAEKPYSFDGFGQIATSPKLTGTVFDAYGRLIRAQTATHDVFFGYDQTGQRIYKQVVPVGAADQKELYLFPVQTFHVGPKGEESFVNIGSTRLVRMEHETGKWFYYLKDHLDSSDYLITSEGVPVEQMLYRAYGTEHQPEALSQQWAAHLTSVAAVRPREKTHHRFTGKYLDDSTGLYYYGARYYDPALGRFVSPDPLYMGDPERCATNPVACSLFAYANNNPMAFIDPTGLDGVVAGDEAFRRQVEESLQRIDPTARVDKETGEISQSWIHGVWLDIVDFFCPGSGYDTGRELVSQVIENEQTTTIQFSAGNAAVTAADPTVDWTTTPGDAVVDYDPAYTPNLPEFDRSAGTVSQVVSDPGIIIGHELIHATHVMAGQVSGTNPVTYNGLDGSTQVAVDEEARTVGVGGTSRSDDITENDLREMNGINPRNHY